MNNRFKDHAKGKVKEIAGTLAGDTKLQAEGLADQTIGKMKDVGEDMKSTAKKLGKKIKKTAEEHLEKFDK